jgi:hypothetical protein
VPALPPEPDRALSRRSLLAVGVLGAGALAGCSSGGDKHVATPAPKASVTPDVRTATAALAAVRAAHEAVRATAQHFTALRAVLTGLDAMHAAHERSLVDAVPAGSRGSAARSTYAVPLRRDAAVARLTTGETHLHDALQSLAVQAQSGEFARLLAGMAAAVSVHRQVLAGVAR